MINRTLRWCGGSAALCLSLGCGGGALVPLGSTGDTANRGDLSFVTPVQGSVVGGAAALAWVLQTGSAPAPVVLEASVEGRPFAPLAGRAGPDRGPLSHTLVYTPAEWLPGPLTLRARYADEETGPTIDIVVGTTPNVVCSSTAAEARPDAPGQGRPRVGVLLDCRESVAPDAAIVGFEAELGDGETARFGPEGVIEHLYAEGRYSISITATTAHGLTGVFRGALEVSPGLVPLLPRPPVCGCERMEVHLLGPAQLLAPRPAEGMVPVQLGPDSMYAIYYFEIEARLAPGSVAESCQEGQQIRRTSRSGLGANDIGVCSAGLIGRECSRDRDCNDRVCRGGARNGGDCNSPDAFRACVDGGGRCGIRTQGTCKTFPFAGAERTDDDYELDTKEAPKVHRDDRIIWLDGPGAYGLDRFLDFVYDADFLSFVRGGGGPSCSCHLRLHIEGDNETGKAKPASTLRVIADAESVRCVVGPV